MELAADGKMKWERVQPPIFWKNAGLYVVADRHLEDGTREHMVLGSVKTGTVIDNANVIGADDVPNAEFASYLSHLSEPGACFYF